MGIINTNRLKTTLEKYNTGANQAYVFGPQTYFLSVLLDFLVDRTFSSVSEELPCSKTAPNNQNQTMFAAIVFVRLLFIVDYSTLMSKRTTSTVFT